MPSPLTSAQRIGALMWLVRPLYYVAEVAVALASTAPYSFVTHTISDLGALDCTSIQRAGETVPLCSPAHDVMNGAFIGFGLLMGLGAVLLHGRFGRGPLAVVLTVLLVIAGLSSIATGLTPLDRHPDLHVLAATPVFVAQPFALALLGVLLLGHRRTTGLLLVATGVISLVAAGAFVTIDGGIGITERIALWPTFAALAIVAAQERRTATRHGASAEGAG